MDENNLDPEQIRQLNEAFQELQETVRSTTEAVKTKDLQKSVDNTKKSVDKLQTEFDKLAQLIKTTSSTMRATKESSEKQTKAGQTNANISSFDNIMKSVTTGFSGLNNATINLIKSFSNLSDLLKDKTTTTKVAPKVPASLENITAENVTIESLQKFVKSLDEAEKSILRNTGYIKDSNGNWKKYSSLMDIAVQKQEGSISVAEKQLAAMEDTVRSYGYVQNENGKWVSSIAELTDVQKKQLAEKKEELEQLIKEGKARKEQEDRESKRKKSEEDLTKNFRELAKATGSDLAKNFFNSSKGMGKYGETLGKFGDGIIDATKHLNPLRKAAGQAAAALFKLVAAALKQNEVLNKAYESLSEFGAVDSRGIAQMFANLQNMGLTVDQIDKFTDVLKTAGPNLAFLGTTAAEGAKKFADTFASIKNSGVEEQLYMLGFNTQTLLKTMLQYEGQMGRLGKLQNMSIAELAKRSTEYAKNLDILSKLTGESRESLEKQQEQELADTQYRLYIQQLNVKEAEKLQYAVSLMNTYGKDTAEGFKNIITNAGNVTTEAGAQFLLSLNEQGRNAIQRFRKVEIDADQLNYEIALSKKSQLKALGIDIEATKSMSDERVNALIAEKGVAESMNMTAEAVNGIVKTLQKTPEEVQNERKKQLEQMKKDNDSQRALEVVRSITERNFEQAKDRLVQLVGKGVTGAFEKLMAVINGFGKWLANIVAKFGGPDLRDLFESTTDIANNLKQTETELEKTNKKIAEALVARENYEKTQNEWLAKAREREKLQEELSNTKDAAAKKEIEAKLKTVQQEENILNAKSRQAFMEAQTANKNLQRLERDKKQLEEKRATQEKRLTERGGYELEKESPEMQRIKDEAESLYKQKSNLEELIQDKSKVLYEQTLKKLGFEEKDLENKEKRAQFDKEYAEKRKSYEVEKVKVDQQLLELDKKRVLLMQEQVNSTTTGAPKTASSPGTTSTPGAKSTSGPGTTPSSAVKPKDAGGGRGSFGMPQVQADEGVEVAGGGKASPQKILDFIAKHESRGDYNILVGGKKAPLTKATVGAVQDFQKTMVPEGYESSAVGRYQIIRSTLASAAKDAGVTRDQLFDEQTQDSLGTALLKRRGYDKYASGEMSAAQFADSLAMEWASLPKEDGRSHYAGVGSNKALTSRKEFMDVLEQARTGGFFSGPESGYPVLLHGNELVVSQPDIPGMVDALSKVKKTEIQSLIKSNSTTTEPTVTTTDDSLRPMMELQNDMIEMLSEKLDAMISKLSTSNDIQDRILTYQQT